jgi:capsular exopolysaccharide synthesis family protein
MPPTPSQDGSGDSPTKRTPDFKVHPVANAKSTPIAAPNAQALLRALRRRWLPALLLGCLTGGVACALVWYLFPPPKYKGTVRMRMQSHPIGDIGPHPEGGKDFQTYQQTQLSLLKSASVLNAVFDDEKVRKLPLERGLVNSVDWLQGLISVEFPSGPEIIQVAVQHEDRETTQVLAEAVGKAFVNKVRENALTERRLKENKLKKFIGDLSANIENLKKAIQPPEEGVVGGEKEADAQTQHWLTLQNAQIVAKALVDSKLKIGELEIEVALLKDKLDAPPGTISAEAIKTIVEDNLGVKALREQVDKEAKAIEADIPFAKNGAKNEKIVERIAALEIKKKKLAELRKELSKEAEITLRNQERKDLESKLLETEGKLDKERTTCKTWEKKYKEFENIQKDIKKVVQGLADKHPELAEKEDLLLQCFKNLELLKAEMDSPARVELMEKEASLTRPDEFQRKVRFAALTGFGVFGAALLLIAFLEFRARRVGSMAEVADLGLRLVGTVPARAGVMGVKESDWQSLLAESVDAARTMLLHGAGTGTLRVVMVTSAVSGEGKTSLSGHMAASLARSGRKTLLIDGDLRNPTVHRLFEVSQAPGFSEILRGEAELADAMRTTSLANLHILPAGMCDYDALAQLNSETVGTLFHKLTEEFDFVIVDSSPVLHVVDTLLLAPHVDGVLFSVLKDVSTQPTVYAALQRLIALKVPLLGAVLNGTRERVSDYGRLRYLTSVKR